MTFSMLRTSGFHASINSEIFARMRRRHSDTGTVWAIGQMLDGYCITPKIQGNKTGLGYAGVIFSFFFWGTVLGPVLGLLLAIPLSAFCAVLWRALKSKYIRPVV